MNFILLYDLYFKMGESERINITSINNTSNIDEGLYIYITPPGCSCLSFVVTSCKYGRAHARPLT